MSERVTTAQKMLLGDTRWGVLPCVVCAMLCFSPASQAQQTPSVVCEPSGGGEVLCEVDVSVWFAAPALRERMRSGFTNTVLYRLYVRNAVDEQPVALTVQRFQVTYELWEERFFFSDKATEGRLEFTEEESLLAKLSSFSSAKVASGLEPGVYFVDLIVEVNPMGKEEEAELRSWLAKSRGGHRTFSSGDRSFFGTFVSLFTNIRPGKAERSFRHQTAKFLVK